MTQPNARVRQCRGGVCLAACISRLQGYTSIDKDQVSRSTDCSANKGHTEGEQLMPGACLEAITSSLRQTIEHTCMHHHTWKHSCTQTDTPESWWAREWGTVRGAWWSVQGFALLHHHSGQNRGPLSTRTRTASPHSRLHTHTSQPWALLRLQESPFSLRLRKRD